MTRVDSVSALLKLISASIFWWLHVEFTSVFWAPCPRRCTAVCERHSCRGPALTLLDVPFTQPEQYLIGAKQITNTAVADSIYHMIR